MIFFLCSGKPIAATIGSTNFSYSAMLDPNHNDEVDVFFIEEEDALLGKELIEDKQENSNFAKQLFNLIKKKESSIQFYFAPSQDNKEPIFIRPEDDYNFENISIFKEYDLNKNTLQKFLDNMPEFF